MICVVFLFGGWSSEYLISCVIVGGVFGVIDWMWYEVILIGIICDGVWMLQDVVQVLIFLFGCDVVVLLEVVDNGI